MAADEVVSLRITAAQKAGLHEFARQCGIPASELIRAAIRQLVAREPIEVERQPRPVGFRAPGVEVTGPPGALSNVMLGERRMVPIYAR